ncbi:3-methylornithyl-N6-L-lysine dehydrogenase PylD [Natroniella acetigena]|uniref:3-methylornithyl-N6-L-lysine dehydrogenase PylD n=1 Tax=Natroniella acetigena TaxID=52004 RepID=UPI00200A9DD9|nr:3-methylornithyl-N6-L-lysine dehydrogenase PylD [Natroniella acetigena]MCK8827436.1 3-methylornithyl-N6-L-lysine dehydrogenase PylD [Natroniella acetigena]
MTRLVSKQVIDIPDTIVAYDRQLSEKLGCNLLGLANYTIGTNYTEEMLRQKKVAIIPITTGQGLIGGFSEAVAEILKFIGFETFITEQTDLSGIDEAYRRNADLLFMADDNTFLALNLTKRKWVNNDQATAKAYVSTLSKLSNGLKDKSVLVLGLGPIGSESVKYLIKEGATVGVYDLEAEKMEVIKEKYKSQVKLIEDSASALKDYQLIIEATPASDTILADCIDAQTFIAAPGVPLGLTREALDKVGSNLIHDPLQLGVAVMGLEAL